MGNWGISKKATPKEKIKAEMADLLHGLNATGKINYTEYEDLYDRTMDLLERMYHLRRV